MCSKAVRAALWPDALFFGCSATFHTQPTRGRTFSLANKLLGVHLKTVQRPAGLYLIVATGGLEFRTCPLFHRLTRLTIKWDGIDARSVLRLFYNRPLALIARVARLVRKHARHECDFGLSIAAIQNNLEGTVGEKLVR